MPTRPKHEEPAPVQRRIVEPEPAPLVGDYEEVGTESADGAEGDAAEGDE